MAHNINKTECLARAKELLDKESPIHIRYAALELRMCMEAITYEKLRASAKHIPEDLLRMWQPPQAVKALLEYEPNTDKGYTLYAGVEDVPGVPAKEMKYIGAHKPFKLKWLRKNYNKIGKFLHFPNGPEDDLNIVKAKTYLNSVVSQIEDVLSSNITGGWLSEVNVFECELCNKPIIVGNPKLEKTNSAVCLNPNCGGEYFAEKVKNGWEFKLKISEFECVNCGSLNPVENRKIDIGYYFTCSNCGEKHQIVNRQWGYGLCKV